MITPETAEILALAKENGWVPEPEAKRLCRLEGLVVPKFSVAESLAEAISAADRIGYPLVAKVVSPKIVHKTEYHGVQTGIVNQEQLSAAYHRLAALPGAVGVLIEETAQGVELIIGAKNDFQFGPVVLMGIGGTGVEICQDTVIRMAPLEHGQATAMFDELKGRKLLQGYRGAPPCNLKAAAEMIQQFSYLIMDIADRFESIDLNPVFCNEKQCIVADARIML